MRSTVARALALIVSAAAAMAQPSAVSMRGRVVDGDNERPLRRALVSIFLPRDDDATRPVLTDEDGRFAIELSDPSSAIVITKAGYASGLDRTGSFPQVSDVVINDVMSVGRR